MDRYSTGSIISKDGIKEVFIVNDLVKKEDIEVEPTIEKPIEKQQVSLKEIDDRLMTIDDFINIDQ